MSSCLNNGKEKGSTKAHLLQARAKWNETGVHTYSCVTCVCTWKTEVSAVCLSQLSPTSKLIIILIYLVTHLFVFKRTCGSQRMNSGHQFSHVMGVGIELRLSGLVASPFTR